MTIAAGCALLSNSKSDDRRGARHGDARADSDRRCTGDSTRHDPNKGAGSVVIDATKGAFRFSTGAQGKGDYKVKTPYGTLGVRG